jgi:peptide/nickel transport system ATP-binding protein
MSEAVLSMRDLTVELDSGAPVVEELDLEVGRGEIIGLVGESGCGKTTTALAMLGYTRRGARIVRGGVSVAGTELVGRPARDVRKLRGRGVSYVPQEPSAALNPSVRIGRQIAKVLTARGLPSGDDAVHEALAQVQLPASAEFARRYPHQLSGGQQQRVTLALALAGKPALVVLDEPTTGLDVVTQRRILEEVLRLRDATGTAMVYVTHDLAAVAAVADRISVMYAGRIVESGPAGELLAGPAHPYTHGLVASVPDHMARRRLRGIPGVAVGAGDRPAGCPFAPRCFLATTTCFEALPPLASVTERRQVRCTEWTRTPRLPDAVADSEAARADGAGLLSVEALCASHGTRTGHTVAAQDVSFAIDAGEVLAVVGESGSGKTTLARCIAGLHAPDSGRIVFEGRELPALARRRTRDARREIQIVFQNPYESLNPRRRVGEQIARPAAQLRGMGRAEARAEALRLLEQVRLRSGAATMYPGELSGGERQRAAIARALAAGPRLLVCDEVTSALDVSVQAAVIELIVELRERLELAVLFISHDLGVVSSVADRALVLERGVVRARGPVDELFKRASDDYTRELIEAAPRLPRPAPVGGRSA